MSSSFSFLISEFSALKGVGQYFQKCFENLTSGKKTFDLLLVFPLNFKKILFCPKIYEISDNSLVLLKLRVESCFPAQNKRQPFKFVCFNESGYVDLIFFKIYPNQIELLKEGNEIGVLGVLKKDSLQKNQIIHPDFLVEAKKINDLPKIDLTYPLSGNLTQKYVRAKIKEILNFLDKNYDDKKAQEKDWIDKNLLKKQDWPFFLDALKIVHNFNNEYENFDEKLIQKAKERLKYDEFLAWQIAMNFVRQNEQKYKESAPIEQDLTKDFLAKIPFDLTKAQEKAIFEIRQNILSNKTMLRLLQGDVGSGKTLVAIYACLLAVSMKKQACVIVPISILADQHFQYFQQFIGETKIAILTSKTKKKEREKILQKLKNQEIDILISTHAVLQDDVEFACLGVAIIDEQHRFGVLQRLKLIEKGENIDVLLMSATPIPRSLMMALYGDMEVSTLDEKPKNRQAIETFVKSQKKVAEIYDGVKRAIARGEKIYWICPLIEKKEEDLQNESDLTSAVLKFEELQKIFGDKKVALIHGKMKESEKEKIMAEFKSGEGLQILVATTVIEVGVDVKDATIIVIENAENFGLSQIHQLRGRVGRSDKKSYCILLYGKKFGKIAKQRLEIIRQSNDGFFIAQEDLKLRGSGEFLGKKQSGELGFKIANISLDVDLLKIANKNAQFILQKDEKLRAKESLKYHALLQLFSYQDCLKLANSG